MHHFLKLAFCFIDFHIQRNDCVHVKFAYQFGNFIANNDLSYEKEHINNE